jgi:tetratricopeptide (TPR) repeat protein
MKRRTSPFRLSNRITLILAATFLAWTPQTGYCSPQESDDARVQLEEDIKVIDGLRRRRLFGLANDFCKERILQSGVDVQVQSALAIEQIKTVTGQAVFSNAQDRTKLWATVDEIANRFNLSFPGHPRIFLVDSQKAMSYLAHGRLLRQEIAAEIAEDTARDEALDALRRAKRTMEELERDIVKAIPERRGKKLEPDDLSSEQLLTLRNNMRYQLAVCNLNRAQLFDATDSKDRLNRISALKDVSDDLRDVHGESSSGQPLWWNSRLSQIECLRLLGQLAEARELIVILPKNGPPKVQQDILEQKLRLAIDAHDNAYSRSVLSEVQAFSDPAPQIDLAVVELAIDLSLRENDKQQRQKWLDFAANMTRDVEIKHGGYWGRRAELVLIAGAGGNSNVGNPNSVPSVNKLPTTNNPATTSNAPKTSTQLDLVSRLGDQAFRKGRFADALKAYDQGINLALGEENSGEVLRLQVKASQVLEEQKDWPAAADRLISSANNFPQLPLAAPAHLRGCWNYAQAVDEKNPESKLQFKQHLKDHLRRWPGSPTTDQAHQYLGNQFEQEQNWTGAANQFLSVSTEALPQTIGSFERCASNALIASSVSEKKSVAEDLVRLMDAKIASLGDSDIANQIFLLRTEFDLVYVSHQPNPNLSKRLSASYPTVKLVQRAIALQAVSICKNDPSKTGELISRLKDAPEALALLDRCLAAVIDHNTGHGPTKTQLLELRLRGIATATAALDPAAEKERSRWMMRQSDVFVAMNRHEEAFAVLSELEKKFPRSAGIQMQISRTLTKIYESGSSATKEKNLKKAIDQWRRVASKLKSHSPNWYEAKFSVAELLIKSGQKQEANKLLRYLKTIPPGWDKSSLKQDFERLLKLSK